LKIIYDVRPLQTASRTRGIGTVTREMLRALSAAGTSHEFRLLCWDDGPPELDLHPDFNVTWFPVPRPRPRQAGWISDRLLLLRRLRGQADLAHFFSPFDLEVGWTPHGPPAVMFAHDLMPVLHADDVLKGKHKVLGPLFKRMAEQLRHARALTCNSHATAAEMESHLGIPRERLHVVGLGVADVFHPRESKAGHYVLYVGGLGPHKNFNSLLHVLDRLPGPLVAAVPELPPNPDPRVEWKPGLSTEALAELLSDAKLLVHPSLLEGFGLTVLEAMASGVPVVCSDVPALREVAEGAARFFPAGDAEAMVAAVHEVWNDASLRAKMRDSALQRAATFTWSAAAERVLKVYESL
jgi:glycosyltransferase involved in cell wall biosynthesis